MKQKTDRLFVRACAVLLLLLSSGFLFAQKKVTGTVTSSKTNQPVAFASVTVKGTSVATATDAAGAFIITVPAGKTVLTITSVGFQDQDVNIGTGIVNVVLKESVSTLDEIVVTGYTAQKKKDLTGSVAVVNVNDMKQVPAGTVENMLQGQAAGVTVINSGVPGGGSNFRIRGISSTGNSDPLIVVDGIQVASMQDINPDDIESIQILKDAGSTAIYGVRGSNGVVVLTTKKGKGGQPKVVYDGWVGRQKPLKNGFNLANPQEEANLIWQSQINDGLAPSHVQYGNGSTPVLPDYITPTGGKEGEAATLPSAYVFDPGASDDNRITKANKTGTDWFHSIFVPVTQTQHSLTASGGTDKSTYLFSVSYLDQPGTLISTYLKRYGVRANTQYNISKHIRLGENAYLFYKQNPGFTNQNEGNTISYAYREQPIIPIYDIAGNYAGTGSKGLGNSNNPYANSIRALSNKSNTWDMVGNIFAEVDVAKHFTARTQFGGTIDNYYYNSFSYTAYENAEGNTNPNGYSEGSGYNSQWTWTNTLKYSNFFGKHSVNIIAGSEAVKSFGRSLSGTRGDYAFTNPSYVTLNTGSPSGQTNSGSIYTNNALYSLFARGDYNYNGKYLFSATVRRDGSSELDPSVRYGVFPSFSGAWRISQENFMKGIDWLSDLKIRGGWGIAGSLNNINPSNAYTLYNQFASSSYYDINGTGTSSLLGYYNSQLGNKNAKWEQDITTNVGIDASLLNNKFDISIDWYKKEISGLLFQKTLPNTVGGASSPYINLGNVENTGIDIALAYHLTVNKDLKINIQGTLTAYKNKVVSLPFSYVDEGSAGSSRLPAMARLQVGQPIGEFFGYKVVGYFKDAADVTKSAKQDGAEPGFFKYKDVNGDGAITDADRAFIGNPNPKFSYGLNLNATYKNFDISAFFYGVQGNDVVNYVKYWTDFYQVFEGGVSKDAVYNSWTPTNLNPAVPKVSGKATFSNTTVFNSWYVEDGSYLRLKQLQIGYTLPTSPLKKFGIDRFRVYLQGTNLFTITKYKGLDPELQASDLNNNTNFGIDFGNYPANQKTYIIGVNLSF